LWNVRLFVLVFALAARVRASNESKARVPSESGFSIAASNASDIVIASNFSNAAIFWLRLSSPNFFWMSAGMSTGGAD
jgi:hypothetical protein